MTLATRARQLLRAPESTVPAASFRAAFGAVLLLDSFLCFARARSGLELIVLLARGGLSLHVMLGLAPRRALIAVAALLGIELVGGGEARLDGIVLAAAALGLLAAPCHAWWSLDGGAEAATAPAWRRRLVIWLITASLLARSAWNLELLWLDVGVAQRWLAWLPRVWPDLDAGALRRVSRLVAFGIPTAELALAVAVNVRSLHPGARVIAVLLYLPLLALSLATEPVGMATHASLVMAAALTLLPSDALERLARRVHRRDGDARPAVPPDKLVSAAAALSAAAVPFVLWWCTSDLPSELAPRWSALGAIAAIYLGFVAAAARPISLARFAGRTTAAVAALTLVGLAAVLLSRPEAAIAGTAAGRARAGDVEGALRLLEHPALGDGAARPQGLAYLEIARALLRRGDLPGASAALGSAQRRLGHDAGLDVARGDLAVRTGDSAAAAVQYRSALRRELHADTLFRLGEVLAASGDAEAAERAVADGLTLEPASASGFVSLGLVRSRRRDAAGANQAFRRAVQLNPRDARARYYLGRVQAAAGDVHGARESFRAAAELEPDEAQYHLELARAQFQLGDAEGARRTLEAYLARHPDDAAVADRLGSLPAR